MFLPYESFEILMTAIAASTSARDSFIKLSMYTWEFYNLKARVLLAKSFDKKRKS